MQVSNYFETRRATKIITGNRRSRQALFVIPGSFSRSGGARRRFNRSGDARLKRCSISSILEATVRILRGRQTSTEETT